MVYYQSVMLMPREFPKRKTLRLRQFDYNTPRAYFITLCTHNKRNILGHVVGALHEAPEIQLTDYGFIVDAIIRATPARFNITIDRYVIMPNHVHLIVTVNPNFSPRAIRESPLQRSVISKTIGYIKMNASKKIHEHSGESAVWQRGFHDHIIRDERDYLKIAKYIEENPTRWQLDCFYTK